MKMDIDCKCHHRGCKRRLRFELEIPDIRDEHTARDGADRLVAEAKQRGWSWERLAPPLCEEHKS